MPCPRHGTRRSQWAQMPGGDATGGRRQCPHGRLHAVCTALGHGKPGRGSQALGPGVSSRVALLPRPARGPPVVLTPWPSAVLSHSGFQSPGEGTARGTGVPPAPRTANPLAQAHAGLQRPELPGRSCLCTTGRSPPHRPAWLSVSTWGRPPPHSGPGRSGVAPTRDLRRRVPHPACPGRAAYVRSAPAPSRVQLVCLK